jgi:hypothetical protein
MRSSVSRMKSADMAAIAVMAVVIVLVVLYIARREDTSPVAKAAAWVYKSTEGFFAGPGGGPRCPDGYTFFNDPAGGSFCCKGGAGAIQKNVCKSTGVNDLCAFATNAKDPRNATRTLPLCSKIIETANAAAQQTFCSREYPNYVGTKCCKSVNATRTDCTTSEFCVTGRPRNAAERPCLSSKLADLAGTCPAGGAKTTRQLNGAWLSKYPGLQGMPLPTCEYAGGDNTLRFCIPNPVIAEMQRRGTFVGKNVANWTYACQGGYAQKYMNRDLTRRYDETI